MKIKGFTQLEIFLLVLIALGLAYPLAFFYMLENTAFCGA